MDIWASLALILGINKMTMPTTPFSLLMSLYDKESPASLTCAFHSVRNQSFGPSEIILVIDGPIGIELEQVISTFMNSLPIKQVKLEKNVGLASALNAGLQHCTNELVARFDTDDWCAPERFYTQVHEMEKRLDIDVLGSWIAEFEDDPQILKACRIVPITHEQIAKFARSRNPMNHMTVIYKKSAVMKVGGYEHLDLMEDYWLWVRMMMQGSKFQNLPIALVHARAGSSLLMRRGGMRYIRSEIKAQKIFWTSGFISLSRLILNLTLRLPPRLIPSTIRGIIYHYALRSY